VQQVMGGVNGSADPRPLVWHARGTVAFGLPLMVAVRVIGRWVTGR
jgi:hypothetical protein